jgi:mutator protein MutT
LAPPDPTSIAVAVVRRAGQVLIGRRAPQSRLGGLWEFPGGKVRPGETPEAAAARECLEETGLAVRVGDLSLEVTHPYKYGTVRIRFFAAEPVDPAQPPAEPFRWVPVSGLSAYTFPPANAAILERLRREMETGL